jgi:uncharacterized protein (TIGR03435 family)
MEALDVVFNVVRTGDSGRSAGIAMSDDKHVAVRILCAFVLTVGALCPESRAQAPSQPGQPAFEVASVRRHDTDDQRVSMVAEPGGRFRAINIPARLLIRTAYNLQDDQIVGGPAWLDTDRFDIVAKTEDGAPRSELLRTLQTLVSDRFKLVTHREPRELPVYALVLERSDGRFGSSLRRNPCVRDQNGRRTDGAPDQPVCGSISTGIGRLTLRAMPIALLVQYLSPAVSRVVIDQTGLAGNFDVDLQWTPETVRADDALSVFTAVQEQLGLTLQPTKRAVDVLVIDHIEPPAPD